MTDSRKIADRELNALMAAGNPAPTKETRNRALPSGPDALRDGLLASTPEEQTSFAGERRRPARRYAWRLAGVAIVVCIVGAGLTTFGQSDRKSGGTAWAAEAVRFAEASPLVLLKADGWRVSYADETSDTEGELGFRRGPEPRREDGLGAELHWYDRPLEPWIRDRSNGADVRTTAPVLGTTARVFQYSGGSPGNRQVTAIFAYEGRTLEFSAGVEDVAAFQALLTQLTRVGLDTWLSAMPPSVVKPVDRDAAIAEMLKGIPIPAGFKASQIKTPSLKDRYQLGAAVMGTVACLWFKQWNDGRSSGDTRKVESAIAAMATARNWPILNEMADAGGWTEVLLEYASGMRSGEWYGKPLAGSASSGLGCAELGVNLP